MSNGGDQFAAFAGPVAKELLGEPNKALSSKEELRFGSKGSISVDLKKGTVFDHSLDAGGGVLWLIEQQTGRKGRQAVEWLREHGFSIEDRAQTQGSNRDYGPRNDDDDPQARSDGPPMKPVKTWDYHDELGKLLFQVVRMENGDIGKDGKPQKTYRQRRPDASKAGGWDWSTKGVRQVPYRLAEVTEAVGAGVWIFIVEGEKAADRLAELGAPATTNARGAGKWVPELNEFFRGARVAIIADDDPQAVYPDGRLKFHEDGRPVFVGIDHANEVARNLDGIAKDVRVIQLTDRKKKEDVVEWLDIDGGTLEQLYAIAAKAPRWEREPYRSKFHAVTWADLEKPGPEHEWLIKGLLTRGETSMFAGPSQSGKSFIVIDASLAIARGVKWFGRRVLRGGVLYQAGEGQKGIKKRIRAYKREHGISAEDDLPFVLLPTRIDLYSSDDHTNAFIEEAHYWASTFDVPLELIVIDTFSTATAGANENDGKDVSVVLQRCARISQATGAAVVLVHHMNAEGSKVRGHTSVLANLENVVLVRQIEGSRDADGRQIREMVVKKNKDGEDGASHRFVLRSVRIGTDAEGDPVTSCVVAMMNGDATDEPPPERPNVSDPESMLVFAIERAISRSGINAPDDLGLPPYKQVVKWRDVLDEYDKIAFDDPAADETDDERKKRLDARLKLVTRKGESLMRKGIVHRSSPWIWLTGRKIKGYRPTSYAGGGNHESTGNNGGGSPAQSLDYSSGGDLPEAWGED